MGTAKQYAWQNKNGKTLVTQSPWSIKGVYPEAREAAKLCARRAGMPMGEWLSQMILSAAARELKNPSRAQYNTPYGPEHSARTRPGHEAYEGEDEYETNGGASVPALRVEAILESIQHLARRVEESEQKTADVIAPIAEKVAKLAERVEEGGDQRIDTAPMERALSRLAERLERVEEQAEPEKPQQQGMFRKLFGK